MPLYLGLEIEKNLHYLFSGESGEEPKIGSLNGSRHHLMSLWPRDYGQQIVGIRDFTLSRLNSCKVENIDDSTNKKKNSQQSKEIYK